MKPDEDRMAAVGKMCEPREKSQRIIGRERDAGCDRIMGMSKRDNAAMPPEAINAVDMLKIWMVCVAMFGFWWTDAILDSRGMKK